MLGNITCKLQISNSSWLALSNVPSLTSIASQDTDALQLESCRENHRHLRVEVETHLADASFEDGLPIPSCSVDKLMTAPPWDRQFQAAGGVEQLHPKMLREFQRVLRPHGRLALLLNLPALEAIRPWLGNWTTQQCRFSMTRHTVGVLLLAQQGDGETLICDSWRNKDWRLLRGLWTKQRADERPWLRPANERVNKKRTAVGGEYTHKCDHVFMYV